MMSPRTIITACFLLGSEVIHGQSDSTILLNEVVIERQRIEELAMGHFTLRVDTTTRLLAASVSATELMQNFGYGHVRGYGPGGLATLSLRGTGASHSSILWNGIPLQSPLNGQADLSLIPVFLLDDIHLQMGGSSSINGNGAIGGTLHLNSKPSFRQGLNVRGMLSGASFSSGSGGAGVSWSGESFFTDTRVFYVDAVNNFTFTNANVFPAREETRKHAAYSRLGLIHRNYWKPANNWLLNLEGWIQDNHTQLPNPSSIARDSQADQRDYFYRGSVGVQYTPRGFHIALRTAASRQRLEYHDEAIALHAISSFTSLINTLEATWFAPSNFEITSGVNYTFENGEADDYVNEQVNRNRTSGFAALRFHKDKWTAVVSAREELVNGTTTPFTPSAGCEYNVSRNIKFTGNASRNYRIPTMNDLYWSGAGAFGNSNLRPEESWSEEVAINIKTNLGRASQLVWKTTAFSNQVDNWILWRPEVNVWSPDNIKKVWSRGSETRIELHLPFGRWKTSATALYSYTRSTNESVYSSTDKATIGKQLVFTPVHEGSITAKAEWYKWGLNFISNFTGRQYTDDDNSSSFAMDPYFIMNMWLTRQVALGRLFNGKVIAEINNILNASYQNRPGYPMPGRNYRLSINFNIHKSTSE
jgi:vitamin B12 transporter